MDILEFGVLHSWHREFTVQGFDPVDQGLRKCVEFCTCLESCEPSKVEPKGETPSKSRTAGKCKAKVLTTPTASLAGLKFNCEMYRPNRTYNVKDCFELNWRVKRTK
eukprot:10617698-Ditylum_brightwellii.AAC.1